MPGTHGDTHDRLDFHTTTQVSPKLSKTPEGFLLCNAVPIARTGTMLYGRGEVPVEDSGDGLITIERQPEEVFDPEAIASFQGKPVTINHPDEFVTPQTWRELSVGMTMNVRKGTGIEDDFLFADLLITDQEAIDEVMSNGLREVSCGYGADYEQVSPGRGVQRNIRGNHVALVSRGRCGPRCAIGDKEHEMPKLKSQTATFMDRIRAAFKSKDEAAMEKALGEVEDDDDEGTSEEKKVGDALKSIGDQLRAMKDDLSDLKKKVEDGDQDEDDEAKKAKADKEKGEKETGDLIIAAEEAGRVDMGKIYSGDSMPQEIASRAEILSPGYRMPTMDSVATKDRAAALCTCARGALKAAYATDAGKKAIDPFLVGQTSDFDKLPVAALHAAFMGASEVLKHRNNDAAGNRGAGNKATTKDFGNRPSIEAINKVNAEFWAARGVGR